MNACHCSECLSTSQPLITVSGGDRAEGRTLGGASEGMGHFGRWPSKIREQSVYADPNPIPAPNDNAATRLVGLPVEKKEETGRGCDRNSCERVPQSSVDQGRLAVPVCRRTLQTAGISYVKFFYFSSLLHNCCCYCYFTPSDPIASSCTRSDQA